MPQGENETRIDGYLRCKHCNRASTSPSCPQCLAWALSAVATSRNNYAEAGDVLADLLGNTIALLAAVGFGDDQLEAARQCVLAWHQLRQLAGP